MPTIKMTARNLAALQPGNKVIDYFDEMVSGLHLRVSKRGTKTWAYFYRAQTLNGKKQRRLTLGRFPALCLADARAQALEQYRCIQMEGADPAFEKAKQVQIITVADMATAYIEKHAKPNKKSWKVDLRNLEVNILPFIGKLHPKEVERHHIDLILDKIGDRGATVLQNRVFALLSSLFNWAVGTYVDIPPTFGMKKRFKEKPRERCLSTEEIITLWNALGQVHLGKSGRPMDISKPVSLALKLLLVTGQRSSEVSQALVSEFDLIQNVWTIPSERSKNGKSHRIPLSVMAVKLVKEITKTNNGSDYLFPSPVDTMRGKSSMAPIITTAPNHALRKVIKRAKLSNITPHDFRETVATGMMFLGVPEQHVAAVLNHSRTSVTAKHYARHSFEAEKRVALDKWANHLSAMLELT